MGQDLAGGKMRICGSADGVWVNDASAYRRSLTETAGDGRRFRVTAGDFSKVANCNFSTSSLGLLVVADCCVV